MHSPILSALLKNGHVQMIDLWHDTLNFNGHGHCDEGTLECLQGSMPLSNYERNRCMIHA